MKVVKLLSSLLVTCLIVFTAGARANVVDIDYHAPKKYKVAGVRVKGNSYFVDQQLIQLAGITEGMEITVPGDDVSNIVNRLWSQRFFEDVSVSIDSVKAGTDSAYFCISIKERPRVSKWSFSGVKSGEKKDLGDRLNLRRAGEFSEYVKTTSTDIIKRFYKEKGFENVKVTITSEKDPIIKNAIKVNFDVDRGRKVRIKTINFIGVTGLSEYKLAKSMEKTKSARFYNFFNSKKFNEKEYANDKKKLISALNEAGYRDAKITRDSIYEIKPGRLGIDLVIDQGKKYYFRNITWTGNSIYRASDLASILQIKKGDVYDVVTLQKRLTGSGKPNDMDVAKLYRDNGYLFFNVQPVELAIDNDSVDVEIRMVEGKQATLNNIIITGNEITNERVIRRQLFTRPGYLYSQSDFERSVREIASLGLFDPEAIMDASKGYSIIPNQLTNTVDISYNVTEKPSSQFELSGGWGAGTFIGSMGVSFNNFSTRRIFDKSSWRPVPLGDAQNLSLRLHTSGKYYTALSASFSEPWLFGKKPISLNVSGYYSRQTNSSLSWNIFRNDRQMEVFGITAGLGKRLKWPDNYFVLYNTLSWQTYRLTNWYSDYFIFNDGVSNNLSYTLSLSRNSTDQMIYPRQGSDITFSLQLTPPFSLFRRRDLGKRDEMGNPVYVSDWRDIDYKNWSSRDRYKWIEYHKWTVKGSFYQKLVGDLVLRTHAQFGYLGYYNKSWGYSPFEGFVVGGDGMSGYSTYGTEIIALRGYENGALTPMEYSQYSAKGAYSGNVYDKFTLELRYPIILQPQSQIFVLGFLEGGNCWADIKDFNPFQIKRSAGFGVRIFLNVIGLLGVDWGYGFDEPYRKKSQIHFMIGQQF